MLESLNKMNNVAKNNITLYHGTSDFNFKVNLKFNNPNNDYGSGLYLTDNLELAKEWSVSGVIDKTKGLVKEFKLDLEGLKILDLSKMDSLYWITILLNNRKIDNLNKVIKKKIYNLSSKYNIDLDGYDVIKGYRADDSYYAYMKDFLFDSLYLDDLEKSITLGNLGIQYCIKSEEAFNRLIEVNSHYAGKVDRDRYLSRDREARRRYNDIIKNQSLVEMTLSDILRRDGLC